MDLKLKFLVQVLKIKSDDAEGILEDCGDDVALVLERARETVHENNKEKLTKYAPYYRHLIRMPNEQMFINFMKFSQFEKNLFLRQPLYMFYAKGTAISDCVAFAKAINIPVDAKRIAYACAVKIIDEDENGAVDKQVMTQRLKEQALVMDLNIFPLGADALRGHALEFENTDTSASAFMKCKPWDRVRLRNEKENCETRITLTQNNKCVLGNVSKKLAILVYSFLNKNI